MREKRFNTIADFGIRKRLFKLHTKSNIGFPTPYIAVVMSTFGWVLVFIYFILHLTSKSEKVNTTKKIHCLDKTHFLGFQRDLDLRHKSSHIFERIWGLVLLLRHSGKEVR